MLSKLLLEGLSVYECQILLKTDIQINKVEVYNQVRALKGVVVLTIEHNDYLEDKKTDQYEYSLVYMKYIVTSDPIADIKKIKMDGLGISRIRGLLQFVPRPKTIKKIGSY